MGRKREAWETTWKGGSGKERGSVRETTWRGGCEEEKERASAGAGDRGEPVPRVLNLLSATPARERSGPLTTLVLAAHALVRAAPALVLVFDRLVPRHCRPGRAQGTCEARLATKVPPVQHPSSVPARCLVLPCSSARGLAAAAATGAVGPPQEQATRPRVLGRIRT